MKPGFALAAAVLAASSASCVGGLDDAVPVMPAPLPEICSLAPAPGMVWVAGGWHWNDRTYVWIPGRWETAPPALVTPR